MKIGKLRIMKSGKVVLRIQNENKMFVDLDVSKGISNNFYQELISINRGQSEIKNNKLEV